MRPMDMYEWRRFVNAEELDRQRRLRLADYGRHEPDRWRPSINDAIWLSDVGIAITPEVP